jgi:hypothetical protein
LVVYDRALDGNDIDRLKAYFSGLLTK